MGTPKGPKLDHGLLFNQARQFLQPSSLFRRVSYLYAERKLLVFFFAHFVATMIIWGHFALIKYHEQEHAVPLGANKYWLKRMTPTLEFGAMHAILFQMALIPLTMCRYTIAGLSESFVNRIVPLNRAVRMHIHLGYTMVLIVFFASVLFFGFFGVLCADGEQGFCDKFRSEIMITGYVILGFLLIIGGTSYFRDCIPYEVFYAFHHLLFLLYAVVILHTFDNVQRNNGRNRSQTFKWFSAPILYYLCDRIAMHLNHKFKTMLVSSSTVTSSNGSKMIILRLRKPILFSFKPGQYAFLQIPGIDRHWHPFSIASGPKSSTLVFYLEVYGETSWTGKLWQVLQDRENTGSHVGEDVMEPLDFVIMGPYGTSLAKTQDYSHVLAVGSGAGIVPLLSLLQQHVESLSQLNPASYFMQRAIDRHDAEEYLLATDELKGSMAQKLMVSSPCLSKRSSVNRSIHDGRSNNNDRRSSSRMVKREELRQSISNLLSMASENDDGSTSNTGHTPSKGAALDATRSIYGVLILSLLPVVGLTVIGLTLSWNTLPIAFYHFMAPMIISVTVLFQLSFAFVACFVWNCSGLAPLLDVSLGVFLVPVADWWWFRQYRLSSHIGATGVTLAVLLLSYQTARLWLRTVEARGGISRPDSAVLEGMRLVWVTRSAAQATKIVPQINAIWQGLVNTWGGVEEVMAVCPIQIHVTDTDDFEYEAMEKALSHMALYRASAIVRGRPNLPRVLQEASTARLVDSAVAYSRTLVAFCGSPQLAGYLHQSKIENDMLVGMLGYKKHAMDFVSESYGSLKPSCRHAANKQQSKELGSAKGTPSDLEDMNDPSDSEEEGVVIL